MNQCGQALGKIKYVFEKLKTGKRSKRMILRKHPLDWKQACLGDYREECTIDNNKKLCI